MSLAQKVEALRDKCSVETGSSWPFIIASGFKFMGLEPKPGAAALRVRVGIAWVLLEAVDEAGPSGVLRGCVRPCQPYVWEVS